MTCIQFQTSYLSFGLRKNTSNANGCLHHLRNSIIHRPVINEDSHSITSLRSAVLRRVNDLKEINLLLLNNDTEYGSFHCRKNKASIKTHADATSVENLMNVLLNLPVEPTVLDMEIRYSGSRNIHIHSSENNAKISCYSDVETLSMLSSILEDLSCLPTNIDVVLSAEDTELGHLQIHGNVVLVTRQIMKKHLEH